MLPALRRVRSRRRGATAVAVAVAGVVVARRLRARHLAARHAQPPAVQADDGVRLHVELDGDPHADLTVVLVHGYGARLQEWRHQRAALAPHARLVLYDQRGHGHSGWGEHRRATVDQLGADLRRVVEEHAGDRPVVLAAHSMGGMAVLGLAAAQPQLFATSIVGVALISTSAGHLMELGVSRQVADLLRSTHALVPALWLLWFVAPVLDLLSPFATRVARRRLDRALFDADRAPPGALDRAQSSFERTRTSVLAAFAPALLHHDKGAALRHLRGLPTLVLTGDDDRTIPAEHSARIAAELDGRCELVVVAGAGHMVNVTHPQEVSSALRRLLARAGTGPTPAAGLPGSGSSP